MASAEYVAKASASSLSPGLLDPAVRRRMFDGQFCTRYYFEYLEKHSEADQAEALICF